MKPWKTKKFGSTKYQSGLVINSLGLKAVTEATEFVASEAAGEGMGRYTGGRLAPTHEEITELAYCLYELRGPQDGYHVEDWLRAEQQLVHHYA